MTRSVSLISCDKIPPGTSTEVVAADRVFAVFNIDGQFHVLDGICPHAGGPLGKGSLQGCIVTCPWHGWQFDVSTGQHQLSDGICQPGFVTKVVDGTLIICIDE